MSTKTQKLFAKYVGTKGAEHNALGKKLEGLGVRYKDLYYISGGQPFTIHGNIPCDQFVPKPRPEQKRSPHATPRPQRERWGPYSSPPEQRQNTPPSRQEYSHGTTPRRTGWIKPPPTPPKKDWVQQLDDDYRRSVIRRRNRGYF